MYRVFTADNKIKIGDYGVIGAAKTANDFLYGVESSIDNYINDLEERDIELSGEAGNYNQKREELMAYSLRGLSVYIPESPSLPGGEFIPVDYLIKNRGRNLAMAIYNYTMAAELREEIFEPDPEPLLDAKLFLV